eukprot:11960870-Alexandrium_andersonii.AAC.1
MPRRLHRSSAGRPPAQSRRLRCPPRGTQASGKEGRRTTPAPAPRARAPQGARCWATLGGGSARTLTPALGE